MVQGLYPANLRLIGKMYGLKLRLETCYQYRQILDSNTTLNSLRSVKTICEFLLIMILREADGSGGNQELASHEWHETSMLIASPSILNTVINGGMAIQVSFTL
jgi:hypothetical protein